MAKIIILNVLDFTLDHNQRCIHSVYTDENHNEFVGLSNDEVSDYVHSLFTKSRKFFLSNVKTEGSITFFSNNKMEVFIRRWNVGGETYDDSTITVKSVIPNFKNKVEHGEKHLG